MKLASLLAVPLLAFQCMPTSVEVGPSTAMPLLPAGQHLNLMVTFEPLPPATQASADQHWQDLVDAGMETARVQMDWADLDLGNGVWDRTPLEDALEEMSDQGLKPFVGIYAIDSEGLVVPADLADDSTSTGLTGGIRMDDPTVIARYQAMLDWAMPLITSHGGFVLSIANEPEGYLDQRPTQTNAVTNFYRAAIDHAHTVEPDLAMTVTQTSSVLDGPRPEFAAVIDAVDIVAYNYYCLELAWPAFVMRAPVDQRVVEDLDALLDAAAGKEVWMHELGCPAGWSNSVIGATTDQQTLFFESAFAAMETRPRLRGVTVFQMVDWSESLFDGLYGDVMLAEGLPPLFVDSFDEWLTTVGLLDENGVERPAWQLMVDQVSAL